ncbi:MAG: hypothetical protein SF339_00030, partial [Blastocatellia bacterium]|nr:hypothetical protein [Blastocatellia bacterium]
QNRKDSDTRGMDRIVRIFQDSQDLTLVGNPVHPEKSCSSCLFFTVRMLPGTIQGSRTFSEAFAITHGDARKQ